MKCMKPTEIGGLHALFASQGRKQDLRSQGTFQRVAVLGFGI
jgi:hypothetical protein